MKGDGYVESIDGSSSIVIKMKARATGNGTKCTSGVGDTETAHTVAIASINSFCTMR